MNQHRPPGKASASFSVQQSGTREFSNTPGYLNSAMVSYLSLAGLKVFCIHIVLCMTVTQGFEPSDVAFENV